MSNTKLLILRHRRMPSSLQHGEVDSHWRAHHLNRLGSEALGVRGDSGCLCASHSTSNCKRRRPCRTVAQPQDALVASPFHDIPGRVVVPAVAASGVASVACPDNSPCSMFSSPSCSTRPCSERQSAHHQRWSDTRHRCDTSSTGHHLGWKSPTEYRVQPAVAALSSCWSSHP